MLSFATYLEEVDQNFIFIINDNQRSEKILTDQKINYEVVDLNDYSSNWETRIINKYDVKCWVNDRLDTAQRHANNVKSIDIRLITFDDLGGGAKNSDINICGLFFNRNNIEGKKVLKGINYLILNSEIDLYKRKRDNIKNILVTLGGSDTYGVTIKIIELLKANNIKATIHIGPSFKHSEALHDVLTDEYRVIRNIPSLIEEFSKYDLSITGGGITPFEANASGLPCLVVANEYFEIPNCEFLEGLGCSKFIGHHSEIIETFFNNLTLLDIKSMSKLGMLNINSGAAHKIYRKIMQL
jgi:spore coat polysaccharide biosynthesis predicted glycosyltransferase SpsG